MPNLLILLFISTALSSCAGISGRTYIDEMERETDGLWVAGDDFPVVAGDSGEAYRSPQEIANRTPASHYESAQRDFDRSLGYELKQKIDALDEASYAQFQRDRSELATISEQIYYLDLSPRERSQYLRLKRSNVKTNNSAGHQFLSNYRAQTQEAPLSLSTYYRSRFEEHALTLGMSKEQVQNLWGVPQDVDYAGDPRLQNERWSFIEQGRVHQVYFEGGQVQGWSLD